jgi:hypothetical protein
MLNHNQIAIVLVIGLVAVLMTSASTRVFAQPTLPPGQIETPADQHQPIGSEIAAEQHHDIESEIAAEQHHDIESEIAAEQHHDIESEILQMQLEAQLHASLLH